MATDIRGEHDARRSPRRESPSGWWMLAALVLASALDAVLMLFAPMAVTMAIIVPPVGLVVVLLLFVTVGLATSGALRLFTGLRMLLPGALAAIAAAVAAAVLFVRTPELPMHWTGSVDTGMLPAALVATAAAALALPRWWVKISGVGVLVLLIGIIAIPPLIEAAEQHAITAEQDRVAAEQYLAAQERPVTTDWAGAHTISFSTGEFQASSYLVGDEGGALQITVYGHAFLDADSHNLDEQACWLLDPLDSALDETITMARYAGICEATGTESWQLVNGSGVAVMFDGRLLAIGSPAEAGWPDLGATRAATRSEVTAAAARLRTVTLDEVRETNAKLPSAG